MSAFGKIGSSKELEGWLCSEGVSLVALLSVDFEKCLLGFGTHMLWTLSSSNEVPVVAENGGSPHLGCVRLSQRSWADQRSAWHGRTTALHPDIPARQCYLRPSCTPGREHCALPKPGIHLCRHKSSGPLDRGV
jgi:hypothetical protein